MTIRTPGICSAVVRQAAATARLEVQRLAHHGALDVAREAGVPLQQQRPDQVELVGEVLGHAGDVHRQYAVPAVVGGVHDGAEGLPAAVEGCSSSCVCTSLGSSHTGSTYSEYVTDPPYAQSRRTVTSPTPTAASGAGQPYTAGMPRSPAEKLLTSLPKVPGASRRQQYSASTKRALIEVATAQFSEHGYGGTSLDAIVAGARVTKGALYHHFSGKQGVFEAVFAKVEDDAAQDHQGSPARGQRPVGEGAGRAAGVPRRRPGARSTSAW